MKNRLAQAIVRAATICCTAVIYGNVSGCLGLLPLPTSVVLAQNHVTEEANAKVELVADGYSFTEGPAVDSKGNVYFTDQPNDRILKVDLEGKVSEFLKPAGRSNGLFFTNDDTLIACADEKNEMWALKLDVTHTVLFMDFEVKKLNGPYDVWSDSTGVL
ncbi:MAG: SMP-30/gluconolactonase/LRE family protein, partial [Pirellula sp.]